MTIEIQPVEGIPDIRSGDDLVACLAGPLEALGIRDGDVVAVTQKIVSKAEGRLVPGDDRSKWVAAETVRVVARRGELVIAQTRHGLVCANAGVDASNVEPGTLALLPDDPDASAVRLVAGLGDRVGARVGVVITDTFGRPWREGLVNVAIGCAGLPALVDLRGTPDQFGRALEATVVALADEVAAASGLVMAKASRVPAALVRGIQMSGGEGRGADLVRAPADDMFRESALVSISSWRPRGTFGPGEVSAGTVEEAVRAACTALAPLGTRPWRFIALTSAAAKRRLLAAVSNEDASLAAASVLMVLLVSFETAHQHEDLGHAHAEREVLLLSAGAAIQNLMLAFHAQQIASGWVGPTMFNQQRARAALGVGDEWFAPGIVAVGPMSEGDVPRYTPTGADLSAVLETR